MKEKVAGDISVRWCSLLAVGKYHQIDHVRLEKGSPQMMLILYIGINQVKDKVLDER